MRSIANAFLVVTALVCSIVYAGSSEHRKHLGEVPLPSVADLEYFDGHAGWKPTAYLEVVNFGGCGHAEDFALGFVEKIIRDEEQRHTVAMYEVGCLAGPDGGGVVTVLQTYTGGGKEHSVFLFELEDLKQIHSAVQICECGEYSYGFGQVELAASGGTIEFLVLTSSASTGESTVTVFDSSCALVLNSSYSDFQVVENENTRRVFTLEHFFRSQGDKGYLIRRIGAENEIVEELSYKDGEDKMTVYEQLRRRFFEVVRESQSKSMN